MNNIGNPRNNEILNNFTVLYDNLAKSVSDFVLQFGKLVQYSASSIQQIDNFDRNKDYVACIEICKKNKEMWGKIGDQFYGICYKDLHKMRIALLRWLNEVIPTQTTDMLSMIYNLYKTIDNCYSFLLNKHPYDYSFENIIPHCKEIKDIKTHADKMWDYFSNLKIDFSGKKRSLEEEQLQERLNDIDNKYNYDIFYNQTRHNDDWMRQNKVGTKQHQTSNQRMLQYSNQTRNRFVANNDVNGGIFYNNGYNIISNHQPRYNPVRKRFAGLKNKSSFDII